jgi:hypothetical protein
VFVVSSQRIEAAIRGRDLAMDRNGSSDQEPIRAPKLARRLGIYRSPMRRSVDRVESVVLLGALLLGLLAVPVAAAVATGGYHAASRTAESQRSTLRTVSARTLEDADAPGVSEGPAPRPVTVRASWQDQVGGTHEALVPVDAGTKAGSEVTIWIDADGNKVPPPASTSDALLAGIGAGATVLVVTWSGLVLLVAGARRVLDRRRLGLWEAEWRQVERTWTEGNPRA